MQLLTGYNIMIQVGLITANLRSCLTVQEKKTWEIYCLKGTVGINTRENIKKTANKNKDQYMNKKTCRSKKVHVM